MTTTACNSRVKSSDTSTSIATTGVGLRIDPPPAEWFLAKVTAVTTSGGFNVYSLEEVEPVSTTYGYQTKSGGFTTSYAVEINNVTVAVDTIVHARFRCYHSTTGETFEFVAVATGSLTHHTWSGTLPGNSYLSSNGTGWNSGGETVVLPANGVISLTGPSIPTGKVVRGIATLNCHVGETLNLFPLNFATISATVSGSSMTIGTDTTVPTDWGLSAFPLGSSSFSNRYFEFNVGNSRAIAGPTTLWPTLVARFHFVNATGSSQSLSFNVSGYATSTAPFGGQYDFVPVIDLATCYYTLEDS